MKAKDTVMAVGDREIVDVINNPRRSLEGHLVMQAEISFKAGYKTGRDNLRWGGYKSEAEVFKAGIKEVVEWVTDNPDYVKSIDRWNAKLKEWGIVYKQVKKDE